MVKRVHSKNPVKTVGAALSLLEHSFRLQWGFRQGFIQNDCFTLKVDIPSGTGTHLVARKFDKEQLELEFHNQILIALCALAISVDKALDSTFGSKESKNTGEVVNAIRAIFYQLRCAWAHDVINPKWNRKENKYKGLYRVVVPSEIVSKATYGRLNQSKIYEFNFEELNGKYVNFVPFGGIDGIFCLTAYAQQLIAKANPVASCDAATDSSAEEGSIELSEDERAGSEDA